MTTRSGHAVAQNVGLRVAVVTETYPPEVNGVAATIARVVDGLRTRGCHVQLVRPRQDGAEVAVDAIGYSEVLLRGLPIPWYPQLKMGLPSKAELIKRWTAQRPDVVHIVTEGPLGWSALQAARHLKLPLVSDFRTNFHAYGRHYGLAWLSGPIMLYLRTFHNRTACTMVPTERLRAELKAGGFERLRVVSRGVDTRLFDPARRSQALRRSWGAGPNDLVVLCVGRLAPEKNMATVVQAFEAMRMVDESVKLVLVGDGPERARLQQRCPTAVFAGLRRGDDLAAHYASADLFLFASITETFGNVLAEAMASGLAVVGFDYAAGQQLVRHGDNGMLVPYADNQAFCAAAQRMAGQLGWVRAMGCKARTTACRLDWDGIVAQIEAVYDAAVDRSTSAEHAQWSAALP
jgi:glycosyltransferase involved in cell wall biosynthesis